MLCSSLQSSGSDFTKSWKGSAIGRFGLVLVGLAFLAAVLVMLQAAFTKRFHRELRLKVRIQITAGVLVYWVSIKSVASPNPHAACSMVFKRYSCRELHFRCNGGDCRQPACGACMLISL